MLPLIAVEENVKDVPGATVPVFVMARVGLARRFLVNLNPTLGSVRYSPGTPTSHPEMNGLATARTSDGEKGISNAAGIAEEPLRRLSTV